MGIFGGALGVLEQHQQEGRSKAEYDRELQIQDIESQMDQIRTNMGGASPDEQTSMTQQYNDLQKQLSGLFQPHEGPQLLKRLGKKLGIGQRHPMDEKPPVPPTTGIPQAGIDPILVDYPPGSRAGGGTQAPMSETLGLPQNLHIQPGMKLDDVHRLLNISPRTQAKMDMRSIHKETDGKYYAYGTDAAGKIVRQEVPNYSEQDELDAKWESYSKMYAKLHGGKEPTDEEKSTWLAFASGQEKAGAQKPEKALTYKDGIVTDPNDGKQYMESNIKTAPPAIRAFYEANKKYEEDKEERAAEKTAHHDVQQLKMVLAGVQASADKGDYRQASKDLNDAKKTHRDAVQRVRTMDDNLKDFEKTGNQQAALSIVANHIGMTLGAQRGARITRAVWEEAINSTTWAGKEAAKWFHEDVNGDMIFDGFKSGVTLTKEQAEQMVHLAHQKEGQMRQAISDVETDNADALGISKRKGSTSRTGGAKKGKWSKSKWKSTHPKDDIEATAKKAAAQGYEVVD